MPDGLLPALESWHDFYQLSGSAAAALLGLLFVSVSLHLDALTGDGQDLAYDTFSHLMAALLLALICLMPGLSSFALGVGPLLLGLLGCDRVRRHLHYEVSFRHPWRRDLVPAVAYILLVVVGGLLVASQNRLLSGWIAANITLLLGGLTAVSLMLLIQATLSAWEILLYLGAQRGKQAPSQAADQLSSAIGAGSRAARPRADQTLTKPRREGPRGALLTHGLPSW
jgi:modulator of FtsH protease